MSAVLVIAELVGGSIREESFELVTSAARLAEQQGCEVVTLVAGDGVGDQAQEIAQRAPGRVLVADDAALENYALENNRAVARAAIDAVDAHYVLMSATPIGWDLAPRLAVGLGAAYISAATALQATDDGTVFTRRVFGGKLETHVVATSERVVVTFDAGAAEAAGPGSGGEATVESLSFELPSAPRTRFVAVRRDENAGVDLTKADVIVSGGRGVGDAEKFAEVIVPLADVLGAAVGASRPVVDAGWLPRAHQVGSSGQVVKPKVYIACGISGAVQHLAGMKNANYIIAVNRDARAPIYQVADLGVVGDLHDVLPALTAALKGRS
jgi:electron transfer flavoprotein alpha subunit